MTDHRDIREQDVLVQEVGLSQAVLLPDDYREELQDEVLHNVDSEIAEVSGNQMLQTSYRYKLTEILKNLNSPELKIYSDASKELVSLLRGDSGGEILREYVQLSPKCTELLEAWKLHLGKSGMSFIISLFSVILGHPEGKSRPVSVRRILDGLARSVIEDKLDDIYGELNSQDTRRQSAALFLLASIVKRGMGLASEVAKRFDFKLSVLSKLFRVQKVKKDGNGYNHGRRRSSRKAFVEFAISFVEVGNPRLLRWILQQKEMYSGVLRGLASDDADTVITVLTTLRNRVLREDSLVPPGLRSVLFGSATLEQLSLLSGNQMAGPVADIAHDVLVVVCTDPQNGLMPGQGLKGNQKRLLDLMRKLKANRVVYHKQLLLAIVKGRPNLCSIYMDEFPYNLEPNTSSSWFSAISLVTDIISTVDVDAAVATIFSHSSDESIAKTKELHGLLKCIIPRAFTRPVINKGLLHSNILVKHGTLRLVLESLKSLNGLLTSMETLIKDSDAKQGAVSFEEGMVNLQNLPGLNSLTHLDMHSIDDRVDLSPDKARTEELHALKHYVESEIRAELPDPQVFLKLLISSSAKHSVIGVKRPANFSDVALKKSKTDKSSESMDILISGLDMLPADVINKDAQNANAATLTVEKKDYMTVVYDIWELTEDLSFGNKSKDVDNFFRSKVFDVLKFSLRTMPIAFEGSFDFFKILPDNPSDLSIDHQLSLLSLLFEYVKHSAGSRASAGAIEAMYRHLHPLINFLLCSQVKDIIDQAYTLVRMAMISTGAFDQNISEIDAWFEFLPGYIKDDNLVQGNGVEALRSHSAVVISFLCDAVSTIGNNLYSYLNQMRQFLLDADFNNGDSVSFSPLVICILQKCLRLLESDSGSFKLHERSVVSLYVGNTLSLILSMQVNVRMLASLIYKILHEKFEDYSPVEEHPKSFLCEWRPLKNLFEFACNILDKRTCFLHSVLDITINKVDNSFTLVLVNLEELLRQGKGGNVEGLAVAFMSSIICAASDDILANLPLVLTIIHLYFPLLFSLLSSVFLLDRKLFVIIWEYWIETFSSGVDMVSQTDNCGYGGGYGCIQSVNKEFCLTEKSILEAHFSSREFAASTLLSFLKYSPFYVLFSSVLCFSSLESYSTKFRSGFPSNKMLKVLEGKISEGSIDVSIMRLKYMLFWTFQLISLYKEKQFYITSELLQICFSLIEASIDHLEAAICNQTGLDIVGEYSVGHYAQVIVELMVSDPILSLCISNPLYFSKTIAAEMLGNSVGSFLTSLKQYINPVDNCTQRLLRKILGFFSAVCHSFSSSKTHASASMRFITVQKSLVHRILLSFREKFERFLVDKNLGTVLPIFYMLDSSMDFMSPFDLLEVVHWMFFRIENISGSPLPLKYAASMGLYVADCSFDKICSFLQGPGLKSKPDISLNESFRSFDASLVPKVFYQILEFTLCFNHEQGDLCLLKVVNAVHSKVSVKSFPSLFPLHALFSSMVFNSPMKMVMYCLCPTSKIKAKTLLLLTEVSGVHMSLFGKLFLASLGISQSTMDIWKFGGLRPCNGETNSRNSKYSFSKDDLLCLLPVALSYFLSNLDKHGKQGTQPFMKIPTTYSDILFDLFSSWDTFVSLEILQDDYDEFAPTSFEEFDKFCCNSLIGKAIAMLYYFFTSDSCSIKWKKRLKLFNSICPQSSFFDELYGYDTKELGSYSYKQSLKVVNEVAARLSYMRLLLFIPKSVASRGEEIAEGISMEKENGRLNHAKFRFLSILFNSLDHVVKQFPLKVDSSMASCATHCYHVFRFLEHLFLKEIVWLSKELQGYLAEVSSFSFVNHFIMSSLFHRFEDPVTLNAIRCIIVTLPVSKFPFVDVLEHLIGHSSFVKVILCTTTDSISSSIGTLLQPLTSILKLVGVSCGVQSGDKSSDNCRTLGVVGDCYSAEDVKVELIRLLRTLFLLKNGNLELSFLNTKELLSLLLCGYSATTSQTDLELFHLMLEVGAMEGPDKGSMEALDYMWGVAALKMRKEKSHDVLSKSILTSTLETVEERKVLFRENVPVDSSICAATVLHVCSGELSTVSPMPLECLVKDTSFISPKVTSVSRKGMVQPYNATFILRFSIHSLLMGFLEPVEFARLGLLAVTFASISSPDEVVRKLGYECLGRFKNCLEHCQRSKDSLQLQLLLTWVQNGITTAWQRIPSVIAIFAAEASFTLLDHSQNHSLAISKFLMRLPSVNLKVVPLFDTFFGSNSIHFRMDRLWILRLLYAGLNSDDDARVYLKNNIPDMLLSYFSSALADADFKILTLMIVRKCVHLPILARHLIKVVGLLPWLSSLLLFYGERLIEHHEQSSLEVMKLIWKIVNGVISTGMLSEWLQDCALEQLSELSLIALKLLAHTAKLLKGDLSLVNEMLSLVVSTLRMSERRSISQPHFFVAFESLCKLFEVVIVEYGSMRTTIELGLQVILMNTPAPVSSHEDKSRLSNFVAWCVPTALWPIIGRRNLKKEHHSDFLISSEQCPEEPLVSKLLRWASASVVLGSTRRSRSRTYSSGNGTLLSYLEWVSAEACRIKEECSALDETLAVLVLHLEGFLSRKCSSPSTASALCILLLNNSSITGVVKEFLDENIDVVRSLCSKIRSPDEANPDWRWCFDEPWKNPSMCRSEEELVEEEQACLSLLAVFSSALGVAKPQGFPAMSLQELESSGLFQRER